MLIAKLRAKDCDYGDQRSNQRLSKLQLYKLLPLIVTRLPRHHRLSAP